MAGAIMAKYGRYSAYLAIVFVSVYFSNLAYMKLLSDGIVQPVGGFDGLEAIPQVIVILLMSVFFVAFVMDRRTQQERSERGAA
jgi:amino acid permease